MSLSRALTRRAVAVLSLLVVKALWVGACTRGDDAGARLEYLAERLEHDDFGLAPGAPFDGEWDVVTLSMTSLAATNLAFRHPEQRDVQRARVTRWVDQLLAAERRTYETQMWKSDALSTLSTDEGHAGYLGHLALMMGAECLLGAPTRPLHRDVVTALARRLDSSASALLQTYPGEVYVPDNVVVVAALSLADACDGTPRHAATTSRWLKVMTQTRLDPKTRVLTFAPGQLGRGSGAAWNVLYLPFIDEALAAQQRTALTDAFLSELPLGASAFREWPAGVDGEGDVDSGPLMFGLSPAATAFAMSAPAFMNDEPGLRRLLVTAETVGTSIGFSSRRYLFAPLVGDAIVLAARTATRWDRRFVSASVSAQHDTPQRLR